MTRTDESQARLESPVTAGSRLLMRLDRNPVLTISILVGLFALLVIGISLRFSMKKSLPLPTAQALMGMAERSYAVGDYSEAIALLEEFHARNRRTAVTETMLGNAYFRSGMLEEAEKHYSRALESDAASWMAMMNLALTYRHMGQVDQAIEWYQKIHDMYAGSNDAVAYRAAFCIDLLKNEKYALSE